MPRKGLEPLLLTEPDPKSGASTNFATLASDYICRAPIGWTEQPDRSVESTRSNDLAVRMTRMELPRGLWQPQAQNPGRDTTREWHYEGYNGNLLAWISLSRVCGSGR